MMDFYATFYAQVPHNLPNSRVFNLIDALAILDLGVNQPDSVFKKRREVTTR
jgi:hypothetical protein